MTSPYPDEGDEDDLEAMSNSLFDLKEAVVGHRIVSAEKIDGERRWEGPDLKLTLDDGTQVLVGDTRDCCAFTELEQFWLHPESVDHMIMGVGSTDGYETWHIYADLGDILKLDLSWSSGNYPYYGYGFHIKVVPA